MAALGSRQQARLTGRLPTIIGCATVFLVNPFMDFGVSHYLSVRFATLPMARFWRHQAARLVTAEYGALG